MTNNSSEKSHAGDHLALRSRPGETNAALDIGPLDVCLSENASGALFHSQAASRRPRGAHGNPVGLKPVCHLSADVCRANTAANHMVAREPAMERLGDMDGNLKLLPRGLSDHRGQGPLGSRPCSSCDPFQTSKDVKFYKSNIVLGSFGAPHCGSVKPSVLFVYKCLLFVLCLSDLWALSIARPLLEEMRILSKKDTSNKFVYHSVPMDSWRYFMEYGYLPKSDIETGERRNETEFKRAIKQFQKMAHLPVTGRIDQQTEEKMRQPRCGVPDNIDSFFQTPVSSRAKRFVVGPSKWPTHNLTFRILNYPGGVLMHETRNSVQRAFKLWSDASQLRFQEVFEGDADIDIKFARYYHHDGYPFDGPGMTLAHAFFPGLDEGGDIHFDEDEDWSVDTNDGLDLFAVAAHEMGHALGLAHSSVYGSLMYPWYQGYQPDLQLHSDDLAAIQHLYGGGRDHLPPSVETPSPPTHRPYYTVRPPILPTPTPPPSTPSPDQPPDPCVTDIDAVALIRQEIYMFKGMWFWRIDENGTMSGYPVMIGRFWYDLPDSVRHLDAVYEEVADGKIIFFSGPRYWIYNGNYRDIDCPREGLPLTEMGFPNDIDHVDAAFVWGYNLKTYFITGSMYWRYNEHAHQMDYHYPRDMSMWAGVPIPVHAAFKHWDGKTYFFHGQSYYRFHDALMRVDEDYPQMIGPSWLGCKSDVLAVTSTYITVETSSATPSQHVRPRGPTALAALSLICVSVTSLVCYLMDLS